MTKIDYTKYSLPELREALESINAKAYPENYKNLISELEKPERKHEAIMIDNQQIESGSDILKRVMFILCSIMMCFASRSMYLSGVINTRSGREIINIVDHPIAFHLVILLFLSSGLYLFYASFFCEFKNKK